MPMLCKAGRKKGQGVGNSLQAQLGGNRIHLSHEDSWDPIARDIVETCGCLLEVVKPQPKPSHPEETVKPEQKVQTAHQTAKQYIIKNTHHKQLIGPHINLDMT